MENVCEFCGSKRKNANSYRQHRIRCPKNPNQKLQSTRESRAKAEATKKANVIKQRQAKTVKYYKNPNYCEQCQKVIPFHSYSIRFCSQSCSATHSNLTRDYKMSDETKNKIRAKLKRDKSKFSYCETCDKVIRHKHNRFCSQECRYYKNRAQKSDKDKYRWLCRFQFSIRHYPDLFDGNLIDEYGWYKCDGKNNNLGGVSRDHKVSVSYGFEHNVLPYYISHPLNCELMKHNDNQRKYSNSSKNIDDLIKEIKIFDSPLAQMEER